MRALRTMTIALALAAAPAAGAAAQDWVEHKPEGAGYRIEMPVAPQVRTNDVPTALGPIKTTMAIVDRGSIAFIVSHNDYPAAAVQAMPAERMLNGVRDGQVGRHKLRSEERIEIDGVSARHLVIETAQGQVIVSRVVLVETRLFQALYVGPTGTEESEDAKRFIASFRLVRN